MEPEKELPVKDKENQGIPETGERVSRALVGEQESVRPVVLQVGLQTSSFSIRTWKFVQNVQDLRPTLSLLGHKL